MVEQLHELGLILKIPKNQRCGDDEFILSTASTRRGFAVSWDNFKQQIAKNETWRQFVETWVIVVTFSGDDSVYPKWPAPEEMVSVCKPGEADYNHLKTQQLSAEKTRRAISAVNGLLGLGYAAASPFLSQTTAAACTFATALVIRVDQLKIFFWSTEYKLLECISPVVIDCGKNFCSLGNWVKLRMQDDVVLEVETADNSPKDVRIKLAHNKVHAIGMAKVVRINPGKGSILLNNGIGRIRLLRKCLEMDSNVSFYASIDPTFYDHPYARTSEAMPWVANAENVIALSPGDICDIGLTSNPLLTKQITKPIACQSATKAAIAIHVSTNETFLWLTEGRLVKYANIENIPGTKYFQLGEWVDVRMLGDRLLAVEAAIPPPDGLTTQVKHGELFASGPAEVSYSNSNGSMLFNQAIGRIRLVNQQLPPGEQVHFTAFIDRSFRSHFDEKCQKTLPWMTTATSVHVVSGASGQERSSALTPPTARKDAASGFGTEIQVLSEKPMPSFGLGQQRIISVVIRLPTSSEHTTYLWNKNEKLLMCDALENICGRELLRLGEWVGVTLNGKDVVSVTEVPTPDGVTISVRNEAIFAKGDGEVIRVNDLGSIIHNQTIGDVRLIRQQLRLGQMVYFEAIIDRGFYSHSAAKTQAAKPWITTAQYVGDCRGSPQSHKQADTAANSKISPAMAKASATFPVHSCQKIDSKTTTVKVVNVVVILIDRSSAYFWNHTHKVLTCSVNSGMQGSDMLQPGNWVSVQLQGRDIISIEPSRFPTAVTIRSSDPLEIEVQAIVQFTRADDTAILWNKHIGHIQLVDSAMKIGMVLNVNAWIDPAFVWRPDITAEIVWHTSADRVRVLSDHVSHESMGLLQIEAVLMPQEKRATQGPDMRQMKCMQTARIVQCGRHLLGIGPQIAGSKWRLTLTGNASEVVLAEHIGAPLLSSAIALVVRVDTDEKVAILWQREVGLLQCRLNDELSGWKLVGNVGNIVTVWFTTYLHDGVRVVHAILPADNSLCSIDASGEPFTVGGEALVQCKTSHSAQIWSPMLGSLTIHGLTGLQDLNKNAVICFRAVPLSGFTMPAAEDSATQSYCTAWCVSDAANHSRSQTVQEFCNTHKILELRGTVKQVVGKKCIVEIENSDHDVSCDSVLFGEISLASGTRCTLFAKIDTFETCVISVSAITGWSDSCVSRPHKAESLLLQQLQEADCNALVVSSDSASHTLWTRDIGIVKTDNSFCSMPTGQRATVKAVAAKSSTSFKMCQPNNQHNKATSVRLLDNRMTASGKALSCHTNSSGGLLLWNLDIGEIHCSAKLAADVLPGTICTFSSSLIENTWVADSVVASTDSVDHLFDKSEVIVSMVTLVHDGGKFWLSEQDTNERLSCTDPIFYQALVPLRPGRQCQLYSVTLFDGRRKVLYFRGEQ